MDETAFDAAAAHAHFSKTCFNRAWELIEKADRTPAEDDEMVLLNQAALWHWTQRADCSDRNRSVGYWQASRIRSLLGHPVEAERYARLCMEKSRLLPPFYVAYAHEALARAARVRDDAAGSQAHAMQAHVLVQAIVDVDERELVLADLATLASDPAALALSDAAAPVSADPSGGPAAS